MTVVFSTDPESSPSRKLEKLWAGEGVWEENKARGTASAGHLGIGSKEGWVCFPWDRSQECFEPEGKWEGEREGASSLTGVHGGGDGSRQRPCGR